MVAHILGGSKFEYFRAMCIHGIRVMVALVVLSMASASTCSFICIYACVSHNFLNCDFVWKPCDEVY